MNYVGKPLAYVLATPEQPDDADNPLRVAFGNEASDRDIDEFARRFDCTVMDGFGSTELAVIITREAGHARRARSARASTGSRSTTPRRSPSARSRSSTTRRARSTPTRRSASWSTPRAPATSRATTTTPAPTTSGCGTACTGPATSPTATPTAGSTSPAAPPTGCASTARTSPPPRSSGSCSGCTRVNRVAVYAVPDEHVGDQVMAAIVLHDDADPDAGRARGRSSPPRPTCRQRPGRATSGSPTTCQHRHQQGAQARAGRAGRDPTGRCAVEARRHHIPPARRARRQWYGSVISRSDTSADFSVGDGEVVRGPLQDIVLTSAGRPAGLPVE